MKKIVALCLWLSLGIALNYLVWLGPDWLELFFLPSYAVTALSVLCHGFSTGLFVALILPNLCYVVLRSFEPSSMALRMFELAFLTFILSVLNRRMRQRTSVLFSFFITWTVSRLVELIVFRSIDLQKIPLFPVGLLLNTFLIAEVKKLLVKSNGFERR
ncbi:MAG: hypothetical protein XD58_0169 [Thermotoga sp. 50_1627]|uniref:hypothetical protein n=1 Tax=Pseudothermotoga sp. TaxID=2033661 RepID=UPI00076C6C82|nr:MAG: hypothetical protein XD45_0409 [Thermotoga sp. 50_64]KUK25732.1 MAG: hypothetical protein XD58_0169 [Thermotoga sp. 50_1627]MBC7115416.1 hypothetical protein [Pseudothermotoga sp.]HBT40166.1 hypothetical protein [Pseudothermotoga sp.]HCO98801.1 hypothetical protein [Pseudothermotoga sp.]